MIYKILSYIIVGCMALSAPTAIAYKKITGHIGFVDYSPVNHD